MAAFPSLQFVDYTKNAKRFDRALPANYHLTFSRSETNEVDALRLLDRGVNALNRGALALPRLVFFMRHHLGGERQKPSSGF